MPWLIYTINLHKYKDESRGIYMQKLSSEQLAGMIDHTLLTPNIANDELKKHCEEAMKYRFKTVAVQNSAIPYCKKILGDSGILIDAAVGFPQGQSTIETKVFETKDAIDKGANEVDYVSNCREIKNKNWSYIKDEMQRIYDTCKKADVPCKVILETVYLTDEEKIKVCEIAAEIGIDYVKTSTGYAGGGATLEDVRLMKQTVGDKVKVKASGGVRTVQDCLDFIDAGVNRIGSSSGVQIIENYIREYES